MHECFGARILLPRAARGNQEFLLITKSNVPPEGGNGTDFGATPGCDSLGTIPANYLAIPPGHGLLRVFPRPMRTFYCQPTTIQLLWNAKPMPKEADFRQTIEAFPAPVFIFDAGKKPGPIMVNSLMCKLLGYSENELIADWKQVLPPGFL